MRKKKHAETRLENCGHLWVREPKKHQGKWNILFGNDNPIHIEIGCGKGGFIAQLAEENPNVNFIAMERFIDIIVLAAEKGKDANLNNVRYILDDAALLNQIMNEGEVERIYLNFSDPWHKSKHSKRRLTYKTFLKIYRQILVPNGCIHLKTDNQKLFEFSLNSFCENSFTMKNITLDLHNSKFEGNIMTEYEKRFSEMGHPIYRLEASSWLAK